MIFSFLPNLEPWFLKTLEISLHATLLIGVLLLLRPLLKRILPPRWVYALWFIVIARMLLIDVPTLPQMTNLPLQNSLTALPGIQVENSLPRLPLAPSPPRAPELDGMAVASLLWLLGVVIFLGYLAIGHIRWSRRLARAQAIQTPEVTQLLQECREEINVRQVNLVHLPGFASPFITGLFHPTIVLPEDFLGRFTREELRWILLHEMAHLKRWDLPVQALCHALQAIHWFNPLVWLAFSYFRTDRELACDAYVLDRQALPASHDYGHALIKVAETYPRTLLSPGFLGVSEERTDLQERVEKISHHRRPARIWIAAGAILCALLAFIFLTRQAMPPHTATAKIQINYSVQGVPAEVEVMQSEKVVIPAIISLGLDKTWAKRSGSNESSLTPAEIMDHVSKMLTVTEKNPVSHIVYITVEAFDAKEAADIANAVVEQYRTQANAGNHQDRLNDAIDPGENNTLEVTYQRLQNLKEQLKREQTDNVNPEQIKETQDGIEDAQATIDQTKKQIDQSIKAFIAYHENNDIRILSRAY